MTYIDWSKAPGWATHAIRKIQDPHAGSINWSVLVDDEYHTGPEGLWFHPDAYEVIQKRPLEVKSQAAVDALKEGEQAWDGEGLPPVGTVCEYDWHGVWSKGTVVALVDGGLGCEEVIIQLDGDWSFAKNTALFRPIHTAEQIAAEEREAGIRQIQIDHGVRARDGGRVIAEKLWDMGYRKQVQP